MLLLSVLTAAVALLAMPAAAKDGVRAKLDEPVRLGPQRAGAIEVRWHLEDAAGRPFGASGIYLRVARCGRRPVRVAASERGARCVQRARARAATRPPQAGGRTAGLADHRRQERARRRLVPVRSAAHATSAAEAHVDVIPPSTGRVTPVT